MGRFCSVEGLAFDGCVSSFAFFVVDSLKRVVSGVCGLRVDPDTKQQRKLNVEIITFRTTHEPIKYLSLFHFYNYKKILINRNLNLLSHLFLPNTVRIDSPYDAVSFKVVYTKMILDSVTYWNGFSGDE